ncbi:hypothetical protein GCK72_023826 [Caenorhabditis remanei]|uniref:Uncharacterized protein n=1 Tax=Caenorhabditis remanei TaxID=31234 RepID=A0A6A5FY07_CAERE|nr:hypothetical protein GCK72_023826 [Caenorhabditis remanei]KAF1747364.1 hypothetical protein GCK72_023826 [Caenorhabditis remanei]
MHIAVAQHSKSVTMDVYFLLTIRVHSANSEGCGAQIEKLFQNPYNELCKFFTGFYVGSSIAQTPQATVRTQPNFEAHRPQAHILQINSNEAFFRPEEVSDWHIFTTHESTVMEPMSTGITMQSSQFDMFQTAESVFRHLEPQRWWTSVTYSVDSNTWKRCIVTHCKNSQSLISNLCAHNLRISLLVGRTMH